MTGRVPRGAAARRAEAASPMRNAFALLVLAQIAIGAAAIFARFALEGGGPIAVSALRMSIAALPVGVAALLTGAYRSYGQRAEWRFGFAGAALALHFACWIASLRYTSVAISTLLVCTTPVWTEAFTVARTQRLRGDVVVSLLLALGGVALVVGRPGAQRTPLGVALALAGALAIGVYLLIVRAGDPRYGTLAVVGRTYPVAAAVLLTLTVAGHDKIPALGDGRAWAAIAAMAVVSQLLGHTALNAAVRTLSATLVATSTLIEPAIAAALAARIFNERLAPSAIAGALLVTLGIAVALRAERTKVPAQVTDTS